MYIISSNMCHQYDSNISKTIKQQPNQNEESSARISNKIFRPWDNLNQDATVSTTTTDIIADDNSLEKSSKPKEIVCDTKPSSSAGKCKESEIIRKTNHQSSTEGFRSINIKESSGNNSLHHHQLAATSDYHQQTSLFYPPDMNLAQNLGLTPNDPLFLESVAQGYALEEYARVLSQEHQAKVLNARKQRPKKYKCPHCHVGFSNNGQLKGHIRIHTGERPFKCDEKDCGKTFTRNEELTRHKRIHSGLRPYPCTHCGKRFGRKDHLKKHSRTHYQPRGLYAVPVMLPFDTWAAATTSANYPYVPMYGF